MHARVHRWERYFLKVIRKEEKGLKALFLRGGFWILSLLYRFLIFIRNSLYDRGWLSRYSPPIPLVISVGNIVVGGAGKTPVTLLIADAFYKEFPMAILARGYRSEAEKLSFPVIVSQGEGPNHPASYSGDEAYLVAENLPNAMVVVARDRKKSAHVAAKMGAKLVILDDAMQHRRIHRDMEVVVMDMNDPFGLGYYLPRGLLREGKSSLSRADLIVLNHFQDHESFEKLKRSISPYTCAPIIGTQMETLAVIDLHEGNLIDLKGKKVGVFCGIAHPEYFVKTVKSLNAEVVGEYFVSDHDMVHLDELASFGEKMKALGATYLVCTEKDRVKIANCHASFLPIAWLKARLKVVEGHKEWQAFIQKGKRILNHLG